MPTENQPVIMIDGEQVQQERTGAVERAFEILREECFKRSIDLGGYYIELKFVLKSVTEIPQLVDGDTTPP